MQARHVLFIDDSPLNRAEVDPNPNPNPNPSPDPTPNPDPTPAATPNPNPKPNPNPRRAPAVCAPCRPMRSRAWTRGNGAGPIQASA